MKLPTLTVKNFSIRYPIWQGGMGVGVGRPFLVSEVSKREGLGILSSAGLSSVYSLQEGKHIGTYEAVRMEIEQAKSLSNGRPVGINVMRALSRDFDDTIRAAVDAGVDAIVSGAGLPVDLPSIIPPGLTALIPIISSARALEIIVKRWERVGYRPDAVVLEGPLAGGHLGFKITEVDDPEFALEKLLPPVLDVAAKHGNFPVIVAGGIYTNADIVRFLMIGASGVQIGTRFLATHESSASEAYKQAVISAGIDDLTVVAYPDNTSASPCGLPFRILKSSPMYTVGREPKCNLGYVLQKGPDQKFSVCQAMPKSPNCKSFLCICNGLMASAGYAPTEPALYTVGTNAYRVNKILSVAELMEELCGE